MTGPIAIAFEDNHLVAVHKPAGLLSQAAAAGDDNVVDQVKAYLKAKYDKPGNVYVGLVHRLDRNVSGIMLLARTSKAAARLTKAFAKRHVDKGYLAVVEGTPAPHRGRLENQLAPRPGGARGVMQHPDGKVARLRYQSVADDGRRSVLAVHLETGRKHQIRAQLALAGHPIVGDPLYGKHDRLLRRPMLHAWRLALEHPVRREPLELRSPLVAPMDTLCAHLGFDLGQPWPFTE